MSQPSVDSAHEQIAEILDEIEHIGIRAETEGRNLTETEVTRIRELSKRFDACEKVCEAAQRALDE